MPDDTRNHDGRVPGDWNAAFAAMPLERPETDAWADIAARMPASRKASPWIARIAIAAALALAVVVPLRMLDPATPASVDARGVQVASATSTSTSTSTQAPTPAGDSLETLYAQSAQLEGLLALARDENVATGAAIEVGADLDNELARIDAQLREPGLDPTRQLALWRARVDTLRSAVSFESTRRWLAANGERYDGALVQVD
ncbi:hypothetical protein LK996_13220 [Lysobacter sp. A6]|uniref:Uncharacterized protein n=1 Tax=Noviluteimonas lactosilytica TaxID=2888523 RepID=A0ABS8JKR3_9GAMM|nr:hypothetical protein [Lysobacter lactosilyticus]MCC8364033.1 hypothetical protein [Lysobacter lactosilyticus]